MLVVMDVSATKKQIKQIKKRIREMDYIPHDIPYHDSLAISVTGDINNIEDRMYFEGLPGVVQVVPISKPYKLASRDLHPENSIVDVAGVKFGDGNVVMIAGPCALESEDQLLRIAEQVAKRGAQMLRGGTYKPRTSPYSFQGLGERGLEFLAKVREKIGLPIVTEVLDPSLPELVGQYADMFQIGTRNMHNSPLLKKVGKFGKPVLMKRGFGATLDETLLAAEYIMSSGTHDVVICERGIRTFGSHARFNLDIGFIPALNQLSHLPIIADPSHSSGYRYSVIPHALAGISAGADGLIVEVHDHPEDALSDGPQSLTPDQFSELMKLATGVCEVLGKKIGKVSD